MKENLILIFVSIIFLVILGIGVLLPIGISLVNVGGVAGVSGMEQSISSAGTPITTLFSPILSVVSFMNPADSGNVIANTTPLIGASGSRTFNLKTPVFAEVNDTFYVILKTKIADGENVSVTGGGCPLGVLTNATMYQNFSFVPNNFSCYITPYVVTFTPNGGTLDFNTTTFNNTRKNLFIGITPLEVPTPNVSLGATTYSIRILSEYNPDANVTVSVNGDVLGEISNGIDAWLALPIADLASDPTEVLFIANDTGTNITNVSITYEKQGPAPISNITSVTINHAYWDDSTAYALTNGEVIPVGSNYYRIIYNYGTGGSLLVTLIIGFLPIFLVVLVLGGLITYFKGFEV
jgi:hypothetical protein